MSRYLKVLGLTLVAAFAMSAIAASTASAGTPIAKITVEGGAGQKVTITGKQEGVQVFTRGPRKVTCNVATFEGTATHGDSTITLTPKYEGCHTNLGGPATVTVNKCGYMFHLFADDLGGGKHTWTATADLECGHTGDITIHAYASAAAHTSNTPTCQFKLSDTFGANTVNQGLKGIDLTEKAADATTPKDWLTADINVTTGIHSVRTIGGVILCGPETENTGTLEGFAELKGEDPVTLAAKGVTIST